MFVSKRDYFRKQGSIWYVLTMHHFRTYNVRDDISIQAKSSSREMSSMTQMSLMIPMSPFPRSKGQPYLFPQGFVAFSSLRIMSELFRVWGKSILSTFLYSSWACPLSSGVWVVGGKTCQLSPDGSLCLSPIFSYHPQTSEERTWSHALLEWTLHKSSLDLLSPPHPLCSSCLPRLHAHAGWDPFCIRSLRLGWKPRCLHWARFPNWFRDSLYFLWGYTVFPFSPFLWAHNSGSFLYSIPWVWQSCHRWPMSWFP